MGGEGGKRGRGEVRKERKVGQVSWGDDMNGGEDLWGVGRGWRSGRRGGWDKRRAEERGMVKGRLWYRVREWEEGGM